MQIALVGVGEKIVRLGRGLRAPENRSAFQLFAGRRGVDAGTRCARREEPEGQSHDEKSDAREAGRFHGYGAFYT